MKKKTFALRTKIALATLPLLLSSTFVGYRIYELSQTVDRRAARAVKMIETASDAELHMVQMSEALRGYLLDSTNKSEFERKKVADSEYVESAKNLAELVSDSKEISDLNNEMAKFDEEQLDRVENEVGGLISSGASNAVSFYLKTYMPLRAEQSARFQKLKGMVLKLSADTLSDIEQQKQKEGWIAIYFLIGSICCGLGFLALATGGSIKHISKEVELLTRSSTSLGSTCMTLGGASEVLSHSTKEQASAIQESVSALSEMASMIQQTAENAKRSLQSSVEVEERSHTGQEIMQRMTHSMGAIEQTNQSLQGIAQIIQTINVKAGVINDIVFKTQLLSFNASIEAARAGQYGKGFAVVAEEVGNLAQMSGNAAREIESLLTDSQKQVHSTLEAIKLRVSEGKVVSDESVRAFNEISSSIREVTTQIKNITDATSQQSVGIEQTEKALNQLDLMARKNADTAQTTLQSSETLKRLSGELMTASCSIMGAVSGSKKADALAQAGAAPVATSAHSPVGLHIVANDVSADDQDFKSAA